MSKLDKMIIELCPDGVEYKAISELFNTRNGLSLIHIFTGIYNVEPDGKGNNICTVMPDFTEDMEELSKESRETRDYHFKYMDLQLWSDYKFNGNEKYKEYDKYANVTIVLEELEELWEYLCNYNGKDNFEYEEQSFLFHRYLSIVPYTCAVLLRDFGKDLTDRDRNLCRHIIFELGGLFSEISDFEFGQAGNGGEAIALGLIDVYKRQLQHCIFI